MYERAKKMADSIDFGDGSWAQSAPTIRSTLTHLVKEMDGNGTPGVKAEVAELKSIARVSLLWIKGIGWAVGIGIAAGGLFIAYLQLNHRISQTSPPPITAKDQKQQQIDTDLPSEYQLNRAVQRETR
jgi:hypothetical protein